MSGTGGDKSYDSLPYPNLCYKLTHPDSLATIATLHGLSPSDVTRARVLELGCASGGNIIPMADQFAEGTYVGVDASAPQIDSGKRVVAELGLSNVTLHAMDLKEITPAFGAFDYIIAHGVYSWVPAATRDKVLEICARNLTPGGVAYISYNANPGWRCRSIVRDIVLHETRAIPDPTQRAAEAHAFLSRFLDSISDRNEPYAAGLRKDVLAAIRSDDSALFHDHMEEHNHPVYFHEFVAHAAAHGLAFVAEAEPAERLSDDLNPKIQQELARMGDPLEREQYLDYARGRTFRRAILCHREATIRREFNLDSFKHLYVASAMTPESPRDDSPQAKETFRAESGFRATTVDPMLRATLHAAGKRRLERVPFERMVQDALDSMPNGLARKEQLMTALVQLLSVGLRGGRLSFPLGPPTLRRAFQRGPRRAGWRGYKHVT